MRQFATKPTHKDSSTSLSSARRQNFETRMLAPSKEASRFAHDFSRVPVRLQAPSHDRKKDDIFINLQGGKPASGAKTPSKSAPAAGVTFGLTGDGAYADTATESTKNISFNVTWSGGAKEDYVIVNWVKGNVKTADGNFAKAQLYDKTADVNFADYVVDSMDKDPAYWSLAGTRWRYEVDAPDKFHATDAPGPIKTSFGVGTKAELDFKTGVYKSADVPTTTTGTISATPLAPLKSWSFHVEVVTGPKFKH